MLREYIVTKCTQWMYVEQIYCRIKRYNLIINKQSNRFKCFALFTGNRSRRDIQEYDIILILQFTLLSEHQIPVILWQKINIWPAFMTKNKKHTVKGKSTVRCTGVRFLDVNLKFQHGEKGGGFVNKWKRVWLLFNSLGQYATGGKGGGRMS